MTGEIGKCIEFAVADFVDDLHLRIAGPDEAHIRRLVEVIDEVPPILVERSTCRVLDGVHRLLAARQAGRLVVPARLVTLRHPRDLLITAIQANAVHGLPLSLADRKAAAIRILASHPCYSDRAVAALVQLHPTTIARVRSLACSSAEMEQLNVPGDGSVDPGSAAAEEPPTAVRLGRDGRTRPLSAAAGKAKAREMLEESTDITLRELARAAGISLGTAHAVRNDFLRELGGCRAGPRPRLTSFATSAASANGSDQLLTVLRSLGQDPSVARTDAGRTVLKSLRALALDPASCEQFLTAVPAHRTDEIIRVIRSCVRTWTLLVHDLESRGS